MVRLPFADQSGRKKRRFGEVIETSRRTPVFTIVSDRWRYRAMNIVINLTEG